MEKIEEVKKLIMSATLDGKYCQEHNRNKVCYPYDWNKCAECLAQQICQIFESDKDAEGVPESKSIWDTPNLKTLLGAALGSPIELTQEEADEIVRLAFGRRPDLRAGKE